MKTPMYQGISLFYTQWFHFYNEAMRSQAVHQLVKPDKVRGSGKSMGTCMFWMGLTVGV